MSGQQPEILTWLRDPDGDVWAIDAADVMHPAPDAEPVCDASWEELTAYVPAGTMWADWSTLAWTLRPARQAVERFLDGLLRWRR